MKENAWKGGDAVLEEVKEKRLLERLGAIADYQFFPGAGRALIPDKASVLISRNTGRPRALILEGRIIATLRASDYRILLRIPGAGLVHRAAPWPVMRAVVVEEVADEIRRGGNLFSRHLLQIDENLRPWDEVLVVDERDRLCGVGRLLLSPSEALYFTKGVAVNIREGVWESGDRGG